MSDRARSVLDSWDALVQENEGGTVASKPSKAASVSREPVDVEEVPEVEAKDIQPLVKSSTGMVCRLAGVTELSPEETEEFTNALVPVMNRYFPYMLGKYGAELILLAVVFKITAPRIAEYQANKSETEEATTEIRETF